MKNFKLKGFWSIKRFLSLSKHHINITILKNILQISLLSIFWKKCLVLCSRKHNLLFCKLILVCFFAINKLMCAIYMLCKHIMSWPLSFTSIYNSMSSISQTCVLYKLVHISYLEAYVSTWCCYSKTIHDVTWCQKME